jgi:NTE family protein
MAKPIPKVKSKHASHKSAITKSTSAKTGLGSERSPIGLALAGGGFLGAVYEMGTLAALSESIEGLDFRDLEVYVGVSAGAFICAGLVNGLSPHEMVRRFIESEDADVPIDPALMMRPDWINLAQASKVLLERGPALMSTLTSLVDQTWQQRLWNALDRILTALPAGFMDSSLTEERIRLLFGEAGRSDDFRKLTNKLRVVATDIDLGEAVEFGTPGFDHIPISKAVRASSAVPGVFAPVEIDGRRYLDGALTKTLHASVALQEGARLVLCLNPLVPHKPKRNGVGNALPAILSQSIRTFIRSRMSVGIEKYKVTHPNADVILFEPPSTDPTIFKSRLFSFSARRRLCEHVYQNTRSSLIERRHELAPILKRHGLRLNTEVLYDSSFTLVRPLARSRKHNDRSLGRAVQKLDFALDDLQRHLAIQRSAARN